MIRSFELPGGNVAPMAARLALAGLADPLADRFDDICLLANELVTNGVLQTGLGPDDSLELVVSSDSDKVRVEVKASGHNNATISDPGTDDRLRYSLRMLGSLADRWGATGSEEQTRIWFEIDNAGSADPPQPQPET